MKLTSHLLQLDPGGLKKATEHPFLSQAGNGTLPTDTLRSWLAQDAHYARGYVKFVAGLLTHLDLPSRICASGQDPQLEGAHVSNNTSLNWRVLDLLVGALANVKRELEFFEATSRRYELNIESSPGFEALNLDTAAYVDHFESIAKGKGPQMLLRGLVTLWATEYVSVPQEVWNVNICPEASTPETAIAATAAILNTSVRLSNSPRPSSPGLPIKFTY